MNLARAKFLMGKLKTFLDVDESLAKTIELYSDDLLRLRADLIGFRDFMKVVKIWVPSLGPDTRENMILRLFKYQTLPGQVCLFPWENLVHATVQEQSLTTHRELPRENLMEWAADKMLLLKSLRHWIQPVMLTVNSPYTSLWVSADKDYIWNVLAHCFADRKSVNRKEWKVDLWRLMRTSNRKELILKGQRWMCLQNALLKISESTNTIYSSDAFPKELLPLELRGYQVKVMLGISLMPLSILGVVSIDYARHTLCLRDDRGVSYCEVHVSPSQATEFFSRKKHELVLDGKPISEEVREFLVSVLSLDSEVISDFNAWKEVIFDLAGGGVQSQLLAAELRTLMMTEESETERLAIKVTENVLDLQEIAAALENPEDLLLEFDDYDDLLQANFQIDQEDLFDIDPAPYEFRTNVHEALKQLMVQMKTVKGLKAKIKNRVIDDVVKLELPLVPQSEIGAEEFHDFDIGS